MSLKLDPQAVGGDNMTKDANDDSKRFARTVSKQEVAEFVEICHAIEEAVEEGSDYGELLALRNERTESNHEPWEFASYSGAVSTETFVTEALLGRFGW